MLTDDQLADQLRTHLHREVAAIQPRTDLLASLRRRQARRTLARQMSIVGVPVTAAAVAVSVLVATGGSTGVRPVNSAVVTAATVHEMANASRLALAHSGRVGISYRERTNGALQDTGKYAITFAGKNWNAVISQPSQPTTASPQANRPLSTASSTGSSTRTPGQEGRVEWLHETNPTDIPACLSLIRGHFSACSTVRKFKIVGHRVTGGVRLTELRATRAARQPR